MPCGIATHPAHPPRKRRSMSSSPGTRHTVRSSMGTTSGGCSFTSWTLRVGVGTAMSRGLATAGSHLPRPHPPPAEV